MLRITDGLVDGPRQAVHLSALRRLDRVRLLVT